jgi:hypothetical protein
MKNIVFITLLIIIVGCNKQKTNNPNPVKGRLVEDCNSKPAKSVVLELWQEYVKRSWPQEDIKSALLETTKTDNDGNFIFETELDSYTKSIRKVDSTTTYFLAKGILGKQDFVDNTILGDLYLTSSKTDLILNWVDPQGWDPWDSLTYFISGYANIFPPKTLKDTGTILADSLLNIPLRTKWFDHDTSAYQRKMFVNIVYTLHLGGTNVKKNKIFPVDPCVNGCYTIKVQ